MHSKYNQIENSSVSVIGDECVGQAWWNYVCQYSAGVYLQCSYMHVCKLFFYYKSVFSQFRLGGWVMK
jgi:hypothetical protein